MASGHDPVGSALQQDSLRLLQGLPNKAIVAAWSGFCEDEFLNYANLDHRKYPRLKVFRLETVRAGFKKAWQERDYTTIISVAKKIPENVLQEDPKLLMWFDQAVTRMEEDF